MKLLAQIIPHNLNTNSCLIYQLHKFIFFLTKQKCSFFIIREHFQLLNKGSSKILQRKKHKNRKNTMNKIQIFVLLGLLLISSDCIISEIITTSSSNNPIVKNNQRKKIIPKEHFCSDNKIQKLTCQNQSQNACQAAILTATSSICGFDKLGQKFQFNRQCEACENFNINYYFKGTCDQAPQICTKTEQCVNGICVQMLHRAENSNRTVCNSKSDCPSAIELCVANKCIDKRELMSIMKQVEKSNSKLAEKTKKMRGDVSKTLEELKKKGKDDLAKIKQKNVKKNGQINPNTLGSDFPNNRQINGNQGGQSQN